MQGSTCCYGLVLLRARSIIKSPSNSDEEQTQTRYLDNIIAVFLVCVLTIAILMSIGYSLRLSLKLNRFVGFLAGNQLYDL